MSNPKRLLRTTDKVIAGVCGGLAQYFGIDATVVRLAFALIAFVTAVIPVSIAYIICWIVIPHE